MACISGTSDDKIFLSDTRPIKYIYNQTTKKLYDAITIYKCDTEFHWVWEFDDSDMSKLLEIAYESVISPSNSNGMSDIVSNILTTTGCKRAILLTDDIGATYLIGLYDTVYKYDEMLLIDIDCIILFVTDSWLKKFDSKQYIV